MMADDVVEDNILIRSDVKDLVRWKSVCKSWYSLISSPYFVEAHLKHHKTCTRINNNDVGHTRIAMPRRWRTPIWDLAGSSNGLVCISYIRPDQSVNDIILLLNPRTREMRQLPVPTLPSKRVLDVCLSFGYDSSTDDYKLLLGINQDGVDGSLVHVFSLKSMTWKLIGYINYISVNRVSCVLLNGAFYCFVVNRSTKKTLILSFDLSREEFKPIPMPDDGRYVLPPVSTMGIFQDNLCISCVGENEFYHGLWVMRNYNSWEFLPNDYEIKSSDAVYYMNIYGRTLPSTGFVCDDTPCLSRSWKHIISDPIYVQSLVSPYLNTEIPSHASTAKGKRDIVEILAKEEGESSKRKREE